jgi:hypothetical protein
MPSARLRAGLDGVIDSLPAAQHVLEMFRRALPMGSSRACLDRLSNRLTKILSEAWAEIDGLSRPSSQNLPFVRYEQPKTKLTYAQNLALPEVVC